MILICYDGSDDAKAAIDRAGVLFKGDPARVLTIWEPFAELIARTPASFGSVGLTDYERIDDESRDHARREADEGAALARDAGLEASATTAARAGTIAHTILERAERADADAIVLGSRGLGSVGSLLLGSVSHAVLQSADRAVVVVPSPGVAQRRADRRHTQDT